MFTVHFSFEKGHDHDGHEKTAAFEVMPELGDLVVVQKPETDARDEISGVITNRWWSIQDDDRGQLHITLGKKAK